MNEESGRSPDIRTKPPSDIELAGARDIVRKMTKYQLIEMGLQDGPPPDLSEYSLRQLLDANHTVRDHGTVENEDGGKSFQVVCADRLIAAIYTLIHFSAYPQDECESIVTVVDGVKGKALICVKI